MNVDWVRILLDFGIALIGALGGGGLLYFRQTRDKKAIEVIHDQADEWKRLYDEVDDERKTLATKLDDMRGERDSKRDECAQKDLEIQKLCWYRCTVNGCSKRKPPRDYDTETKEENQL